MSFSHGKDGRLHVNGNDLSPYFKSVSTSGEIDTADTSALSDSHRQFITGQAGAEVTGDGMLDQSADAIEPVLTAALDDLATEIVHWHAGDALGAHGTGMQAVETTYNIQTPVEDVAAVNFAARSKTAFEAVVSLVPKASSFAAGTTIGGTIDNTAASTAGASGYLHAFSHGGAGTVGVIIQHSPSGTAGWTDLITFSNVTAAHVSERGTATGTVNRYLRTQVIKTGAGSASIGVSASRTPYL